LSASIQYGTRPRAESGIGHHCSEVLVLKGMARRRYPDSPGSTRRDNARLQGAPVRSGQSAPHAAVSPRMSPRWRIRRETGTPSSFLVSLRRPGARTSSSGITAIRAEADLRSVLSSVAPSPDFTYEVAHHDGLDLRMIAVHHSRIGPFRSIRDFGNSIRANAVCFRRGPQNDLAAPEVSSTGPIRASSAGEFRWSRLGRFG